MNEHVFGFPGFPGFPGLTSGSNYWFVGLSCPGY